jgi:hypothetical protein
MTCEHVQETLTDHVLDETIGGARDTVDAHLSTCAACAGDAERLRLTIVLLREHVPSVSALAPSRRDAIQAASRNVPSRRVFPFAVAAVLVLSVAAWRLLSPPAERPSPTRAPIAAAAVRFTSIEGSVKVRLVGTFEWIHANKDLILRSGDLVKTGSGSTSEITFFDGTVIHVRPESLISIEEAGTSMARPRLVAWHVAAGEVSFTAARRTDGGPTEITTPLARLTTRSEAEGSVGVKESGESRTRLFRGQVDLEVTKSGERIALGPKEAVTIDSDGRVSAKAALPSVPEPISPADEADLAYADPTRAITPFLWKSVPGARRYHLMLDFSPKFSRPLHDTTIESSTTALTGLDVGRYYWRVAAIDADGNESGFSEPGRFRIVRLQSSAGAPPALVISSLETRGNILQIKGRTEPGATVSINGQPLDVEADGTFNEFVTLDKSGPQQVIILAVGTRGGVSKRIERVVVTF